MSLIFRPTNLPPSWRHSEWTALSGELIVGRIEEVTSNTDVLWFWGMSGVHGPPEIMQISGMAPTLDQAKAEFKENWEKWLAWANLQQLSDPTPPLRA
jgi:hypothetical protein